MLRVLLLIKTLENDMYGLQKLMTKSSVALNISLCIHVHAMGVAIFWGVIPIYGVIPYSIILYKVRI